MSWNGLGATLSENWAVLERLAASCNGTGENLNQTLDMYKLWKPKLPLESPKAFAFTYFGSALTWFWGPTRPNLYVFINLAVQIHRPLVGHFLLAASYVMQAEKCRSPQLLFNKALESYVTFHAS